MLLLNPLTADPQADRRARRQPRPEPWPTGPRHGSRAHAHRRHAAWTPAQIMDDAHKIGPAAAALLEAIMADRPYPKQGFRNCLRILALEKT